MPKEEIAYALHQHYWIFLILMADEERYRITSESGISELDEAEFNIVNPIIKGYLSYTIKAKEIVY